MWKGHKKGAKQNVGRKMWISILRKTKTKTLNNFKNTKTKIKYLVISFAIIWASKQVCAGSLHVILDIKTWTRDGLVFPIRLIGYLTLPRVEWPRFIKTGFSTKNKDYRSFPTMINFQYFQWNYWLKTSYYLI